MHPPVLNRLLSFSARSAGSALIVVSGIIQRLWLDDGKQTQNTLNSQSHNAGLLFEQELRRPRVIEPSALLVSCLNRSSEGQKSS
jgi:hypothetical protein